MAEMLSDQYSSVFSVPQDKNISSQAVFPDVNYTHQGLPDIIFNDCESADAMQ